MKKFYLIPEHSDNVAGISSAILYATYKARRENKKVVLVHKQVPVEGLLKRKNLAWTLHKHPLYELEGPYIAKTNQVALWLVSMLYGWLFTLKWVKDALKWKLGLMDHMEKLPPVGTTGIYPYWPKWKEELNNPPVFRLPEWKLDVNPMGEAYVCLHIRTSKYRGPKENTQWRNSSPKNYDQAIDYLISKGLQVIRMGDPWPGFIKAREGYFDYASSAFKSEKMDLWLIKNCYFYIGTNSGIWDTAVLFGKPMLSVNVTDFFYPKPLKDTDIMIYKQVWGKKEPYQRYLSLLPFSDFFGIQYLHDFFKDYVWLENTPEDILEATIEMVGNLKERRKLTDRQRAFSLGVDTLIKRSLEKSPDFRSNLGDKYRNFREDHARIFIQQFYNGRFGSKFCDKYL